MNGRIDEFFSDWNGECLNGAQGARSGPIRHWLNWRIEQSIISEGED
jgi:hypothetical protein